jgi:hypothetical protein
MSPSKTRIFDPKTFLAQTGLGRTGLRELSQIEQGWQAFPSERPESGKHQ